MPLIDQLPMNLAHSEQRVWTNSGEKLSVVQLQAGVQISFRTAGRNNHQLVALICKWCQRWWFEHLRRGRSSESRANPLRARQLLLGLFSCSQWGGGLAVNDLSCQSPTELSLLLRRGGQYCTHITASITGKWMWRELDATNCCHCRPTISLRIKDDSGNLTICKICVFITFPNFFPSRLHIKDTPFALPPVLTSWKDDLFRNIGLSSYSGRNSYENKDSRAMSGIRSGLLGFRGLKIIRDEYIHTI